MGIPDDKIRITVTLERQAYDQIIKISDLLGLAPAKLATNLIYIALDDAKILDKFGMFHIANKIKLLKKFISDAGDELAVKE